MNLKHTSESKQQEGSSMEVSPIYFAKPIYLLFILPIVYGVLASLYYYQSKAFFTTYPDSTYIYLINGVNIASGNFAIGHIDNPGTTAHWLAGIIIFITHLFIGKGSINEDVLSNPELYLKICAIVCIALLLFSVFASGKLIFKKTGDVFVALCFQLVPISSYLAVHHIVRICPEYLMIMILPYYCAYLWVLCYKKNNLDTASFDSNKTIFFLSFITASLFIAKITCLPFLIVPLFFIKKFQKKIAYLFTTLIFAALILFPVWPNLRGMFSWFLGLATHTGIYGSGNEQIVDAASYLSHLKELFKTELFFTIGYTFISAGVIVGLLLKKRKDNFYKLAFAFWITISLQILLAAKHYKYHYIIPSQLLIIPSILACCASFEILKRNRIMNFLLLFLCGSFLIFKLVQSATDYKEGNKLYESSLIVQKYSNTPKIITTSYNESCFVESALHFGAAYGGQCYQSSYTFLKSKYPDSYFYLMDNKTIAHFDQVIPFSTLSEKYNQILIYFLRMDENTEKDIIKNIIAGNDSLVKNVILLEQNYDTGEKFYTLDISKTKSTYSEKLNIICDFEKKSKDKSTFVSTDGNFYFGATELSSNQKYTSGSTSVKSTPKNQYTCWTTFAVKPGDMLDISVNNNSDDIPGGIVLSSSDGKAFYRQSAFVVDDYGNGWKKINLKTKIPYNYPEKEIRFSLFYFGTKTCYFDDLNIVFSKQ